MVKEKSLYYLGKGAFEDNIFHDRSWAFVGHDPSEPIAMFETADMAIEYIRLKRAHRSDARNAACKNCRVVRRKQKMTS